ncbi:zinc-dependent metalloprotease [Bdellovibrio svalbardensis]|uniref:Zinc-dependent metalloprotease n=1 Tax=Bdellovibrio svalbardensis TaxID=2972972 RepID=A0ABT6DFH0_9BACT|nr:zinc-dependent metalloprotease [Bdellovibrio svalbardensis]MDG0815594.1 zinc-dependent metalloprotease [Bdellovibrio svalbardensis]
MAHRPQYTKAFTALLSFALLASGCTKTRDAALTDTEALQTFAISDFGTISESAGYKVSSKASVRTLGANTIGNKASEEKGLVTIDPEDSAIPQRLRFMFNNLEVSGQESQDFKIVFGVDSKYVTAYKLTNNLNSLTKLEKQLAVSPGEVQLSIELQKATIASAKKEIVAKMAAAQKARSLSITNRAAVNVLVPLFKYDIQAKGVLERTKNELRESTSTLTLRETEFSQATHIRLNTTSDGRKDVGSVEQKREMDQIFTMESLDNKVSTAADLQARYNFNMKFVADDAKVLTKLDSEDMKVYELTKMSALSADEQRLINTGRANGEILRCDATVSTEKDCVLRLVAKVPVTYKNARLNLADSKENTSNTLELQKVTKAQAQGLVEISREVRAERARPTGIIDPLNTIKVSDLNGEFYFRRTFEDASNMMVVGKTGTSGDMAVVKFELEKDRLVVRNQKALIQYIGQGPKDKEELVSVPVKYFKLETVDADGVAVQVAKLIEAKKEDAEYLEIDWTKNTIPVANSPLAFFDAGACWQAETSQSVTDMDMRLANDGIMQFSLAGSYTVRPDCANQTAEGAQLNYNVVERLSFKKRTNAAVDDTQFAPNISTSQQSSMNFAIFTMSDTVTTPGVRAGREGSQINRPIIHDFRNGKVLNYWVGGLANAPKERRALIEEAAKEVVAEWNEAFHKAFKGTDMDRSGDFIVLNTEDDATRGHLGDLDRNYLWFMDMPAENGLLGVAQFAPNPYSGTIMANNVIVYSGNSETEVRGMMENYKESREYEKLLEEAKTQALAEFQKQQAEEAAAAKGQAAGAGVSTGNAAADSATSLTKNFGAYLKKLVLSARPVVNQKMTSKITSLVSAAKAGKTKGKAVKGRTQVSEAQVASNKDFTRRVLETALAGDFKNDPMMLEAIIARELVRTEKGLSPEIKAVLTKQAQMKEMTAKFENAAKKRGGCFLYSRNEYNDKFLEADFNTLFKKEIKATLLHEVGHAIGLRHNFKGSFDKENFNFAGEKTARNYTSIMDYIAAPEMEYVGPGTYDVHALRAIYTGLLEVSDKAKEIAAKTGGMITNQAKESVSVIDGKFMKLDDVKKFLGYSNWSEMQKQNIDKSGLLKHYSQCHDELVGVEPACTLYDQGASATEIVKNEIQNYNRSYATSYHAGDRINFGWSNKVAVIRRSIERFRTVRGFLDDYFQMVIYRSALNQAELADFREAAYLGYDFFHEVLRIPNTDYGFGKTKEEIQARLIPVPYVLRTPVLNEDGSQAVDAAGKAKFDEKNDIKILEARRVYDASVASTGNRLDTLGIGYDKQFALQFLLTANPAALTDDSQTGWIGYNEFEQYFLGVQDASQSTNMITLLEIMTGELKAGFVDQNHNLQTVDMPVEVNRNLLDAATLGSLADTNQYRSVGLDTFAEFFKVGTLKGGRTIKDRAAVARYGQSSKSAAGVKFFAADNATGANVLVDRAARKGLLLENKADLSQGIINVLNADMTLNGKVAAAIKADPKLKGKAMAEIIATSEELKKLQADGEKVAQDLVKSLEKLNANEVLVSKQQIAANPNLALDVQVKMLRGMMTKSMTYFTQLKPLLEQVPLDQLDQILQQVSAVKATNAAMAQLDLLGLGQEVLTEATANISITLKGKGTISGDVIMGLMMEATPLTTAQQNLMYTIEDLARFTSMLNPEYVY